MKIFVAGTCLILILLYTNVQAQYFTPLSHEEIAWEATWQLLVDIDCHQTLYIADHPAEYSEVFARPFIGRHPRRGDVLLFFGTIKLGHYIATRIATKQQRWWWQRITVSIGVVNDARNFSIGIRY